MNNHLALENIYVNVAGEEVVHGVTIDVPRGKVVALMGPNGSGKSSLVHAVVGHPRYLLTAGSVLLDGEDITALPPHEKARRGLFLSFQYPPEISGVTVAQILRSAYQAKTGEAVSPFEFQKHVEAEAEKLGIEKELLRRHLGDGFSGGEKKKAEVLQLAILQPKYALLDETDAGLDVDALKTIAGGILHMKDIVGVLLITHYRRILEYIVPDEVHIMRLGRMVRSGGAELAERVEKNGYDIFA